jgi:hypothetical protein
MVRTRKVKFADKFIAVAMLKSVWQTIFVCRCSDSSNVQNIALTLEHLDSKISFGGWTRSYSGQ